MRSRVPRVCTTGALGGSRRAGAPVDEVMRVLELFETRYPDFTAKHFHEKLVYEHGFGLEPQLASPEWTLLTKVETSCDRILIAGGANVEAEWEQEPAV